MNTYKIKIDTIFDTAPSMILLEYNSEKKCIMYCEVCSHLHEVKGSRYEWRNESCYGQCILLIKSLDIFAEVADSIKDNDWKYINSDRGDVYDPKNPLANKSLKQAVLKALYTLADNFRDFVVDNLKKGGFEDLMDSEGWMDAWNFKRRLDDMNDVRISLMLLLDLPNHDNRFLAKGEYDFDNHEDTRKIKFSDR